MQLFTLEHNIAKPVVETLLIPCFKKVWDADTSEKKSNAIREFTYIEFMCSPKKTNPFNGYPDSLKESKIIQTYFKDESYTPSEDVKECIKMYKEFFYNASPSLAFLESARLGAEKLQTFFRDVDLNERSERGAPIYKPKEVSSSLTDAFNVIKTLNALQEKVDQEVFEETKTKGGKETNPREV